MTNITVKTQQPYNVTVTRGWQSFSLSAKGKVCVISDDNVAPLYMDEVCSRISAQQVLPFVFAAGESSKNAEVYFSALSFLAQNAFTRNDIVVALGGGVVGDLAGFVAATYMRGIRYCQLPTSLLAMIDSSVGGKTAIDLPQGKNLVGAFHQPMLVYANLDTLKTLPQKEVENGKGELVKYALLSPSIGESLDISENVIAQCVRYKAQIVADDEKEQGKRMLLNLGHTVGHALETLFGFTVPHGLCVAKGLRFAISLSQRYYGFSDLKAQQLQSIVNWAGLDLSQPFTNQQILAQIYHDKKAADDGVNFVLIADIGDCRVEKLSFDSLEKLL